MNLINTDYTTLEITAEEVLKSLGRTDQKVSDELLEKTEEMINLLKDIARPRSALITGKLTRKEDRLYYYDVKIESHDLYEFLDGCDSAALMAVTLGLGVDRTIKSLESSDLNSALLLDAAASVLVEKVCDKLTSDFEKAEHGKQLFITERFSPGYGDCPLSLQPQLLNLLDGQRKLGLTCSETHLLFPRKSVTAFIGVLNQPRKPKFNRCKICRRNGECKYGICTMI